MGSNDEKAVKAPFSIIS
jgi:ubiquitin carboxyl-terminal hydrolase 9/24